MTSKAEPDKGRKKKSPPKGIAGLSPVSPEEEQATESVVDDTDSAEEPSKEADSDTVVAAGTTTQSTTESVTEGAAETAKGAADARPTVVVTGASSGIGWGCVQEFVAHGYRVVGTVRKAEDVERLRASFGESVHPILLDVTEDEQIEQMAQEVSALVGEQGVAGLINNAGIAIAAPLMHVDLDDLRYQFDVNVVGAVAVTQALLPLLGARRNASHAPGRIINISSVSGHITYPFLAPYAASKHALESISDGMRRELSIYDIKVIVLVFGSVSTPIWEKTENQDIERYMETDYAKSVERMHKTVVETAKEAMPVENAARAVRRALEEARPRTRYVIANNRLLGWLLPRWMPERLLDWALRKQLEDAAEDNAEDSSENGVS